jgi:hypothetical protein
MLPAQKQIVAFGNEAAVIQPTHRCSFQSKLQQLVRTFGGITKAAW